MRFSAFLLSFVLVLNSVANAATISASMNPNASGFPGAAYTDYNPTTQSGTLLSSFGISTPGQVPNDNGVYTEYMKGAYNFTPTSGKGYVATTVRRNGTDFFTTTQAWYDTGFSGVVSPMVRNTGYWEFVVQGSPGMIANYSYAILAQKPQIEASGVIPGNTRVYQFVRVEGINEVVLNADSVGTAATSFSGALSSGTYRLYYDHRNFSPSLVGPTGNVIGGTNMDIKFTFVSETPVPEPASLAVFGILGVCGAVSRLRRKK